MESGRKNSVENERVNERVMSLLGLIITFALVSALVELPFTIWRVKATQKKIEATYAEGFRAGANFIVKIYERQS